jgi:hypothetical protein
MTMHVTTSKNRLTWENGTAGIFTRTLDAMMLVLFVDDSKNWSGWLRCCFSLVTFQLWQWVHHTSHLIYGWLITTFALRPPSVQAVLWPSQITHVHTALGEEKNSKTVLSLECLLRLNIKWYIFMGYQMQIL